MKKINASQDILSAYNKLLETSQEKMKTKIYSFLSFILIVLIIISCGHRNTHEVSGNSRDSMNSKNYRNSGNTKNEKNKKNGESITFKRYIYVDQQGTGIEAFRVLIPKDWQFQGGITWVLDRPSMPASSAFRIYDPKGRTEFEVFPNEVFFWTNNRMITSFYPTGSRYFGTEVRQPMSAVNVLSYITLPRYRQNYTNLKFISQKQLPELVQAINAGASQQGGVSATDGAKIRIEYEKNGVQMEEEIYCVIEQMTFNTSTMYGTVFNTYWYADHLFSCKAEKGKLEPEAKILKTIAFSFKINPLWYSKYSQVIVYLAQRQIQKIHSIGQLSRILSQTSNDISDMMMESYNQRQAANDRISENFSDYIRGVDKYYDPYSDKPVDLPSGYNQAWANNLGEYIVSDNPNFNPNVGSNQNWQEMTPQK